MRISKGLTIVLAVFLLLGAGCNRQIAKFEPTPVGNKTNPTLDRVTQAITDAGELAQWRMKVLSPGIIEAMKVWAGGKHNIVVDVVYDADKFGIQYKSSKNLRREGEWVHGTYNIFTRELHAAIKLETSRL